MESKMTCESGKKSKMTLESGHTVEEVSEEEQAQINKEFKAYKLGMIRLQPGGWFFLKSFSNYANKLHNFKIRPIDVFVLTFPKSGTTWMQEIIWTMKNNPNLDNPLHYLPVFFKSPEFDLDFVIENPYWSEDKPKDNNPLQLYIKERYPDIDASNGILIQYANHQEDPRILKSHLPFSLLPKDILDVSKAIYVARNPKDVCISYHHHCKLMKFNDFIGTLDQYVDRFVKDSIQWGPYWEHVKEGWAKKDHPNLHWVFYEDLKANPKEEIKRIDKFLGTNLTEQQIDNVVEHTSFDTMKERDSVIASEPSSSYDDELYFNMKIKAQDGGLLRKGEVGDHKAKLTKAQEEKIDAWVEANTRGWDGPELKWKQG